MRLVLITLIVTCPLWATDLAILSPVSGGSVSGYSGAGNPNSPLLTVQLNTNLDQLNNEALVCFKVDGYNLYNPGFGAPYSSDLSALYAWGCMPVHPLSSSVTTWSMPWNTNWFAPGNHILTATAYDVTGNFSVATTEPFIIANTWPVSCSGVAPASSMSLSSVSGGYITATLTTTGPCAADTKLINWYIDGVPQTESPGLTTTSATSSAILNESQWDNNNHQICIGWLDQTMGNYAVYGSHNIQAAGQLCQTVPFSNGSIPQEVRSDCSVCFISTGGTHTLTPVLYNVDGSTTGGITFDYLALNPSVSSVNSSGVITATGTCPVAQGLPCSGQILIMGETQHCTDLQTYMGTKQYQSTCYTFTGSDIGRILNVTGGTGFTQELTQITQVTPISGGGGAVIALNPSPTSTGTFTGGQFSIGPTRTVNTEVWATNTNPSWGTDGLIHSSYVSASFIPHSMFSSSGILFGNSIPNYNYIGGLTGPLAEYDNIGINTWEIPIMAEPASSYNSSTLASFTTAETNFLNQYSSNLASLTNAKYLYGIGDNLAARTQDQWTANQGGPSMWDTGMMTQILNQIDSTYPHKMLGINLADEGAKNNPQPLAGPIIPGGSNSWLSASVSVISDGAGNCTITTAPGVNYYLNSQLGFVISGSSTSSVNTAMGATYTAPAGSGSVSFNYSCGTVAGTFNDATLQIQPIAAFGYTLNSNTSFLNYDAFANLFGVQVAAQTGNIPVTMSSLSAAGCLPRQTWGGLSTYGPIHGITQIGKYQDFYDDNSQLINFLNSRNSMQWIATGLGSPGLLQYQQYGCYNPNLPLSELTGATENIAGIQGYSVPVTSIVGNVITFASDHGLRNIVPGDTRITVSGNSNSAMNTYYYATEIIDTTHILASWGTTDFVAQCNNGTLNFTSGYTRTSSLLSAIGLTVDPNIQFYIGSGPSPAGTGFGQGFGISVQDTNMPKHRGEHFTVSGCSSGSNAAAFNTPTFMYATTNLGIPSWDANAGVTPEKDNVYWEIPTGSGTGGSAVIQPDNTSVPGRTGVQMPNENSPSWAFINTIEAFIAGAQMDRWYQQPGTQYSYQPNWGYEGFGRYNSSVFASGTSQSVIFTPTGLTNQFYVGPHWENMGTVPIYHALGRADKSVTRWQKYLLQPKFNSPDLGGGVNNTVMDCTARGGSIGNILLCGNDENGTETKLITLTPYLKSGQSIIENISGADGTNTFIILPPGTNTQSVTLSEGWAVFFIFPTTFAGELNLPSYVPSKTGTFGDCPTGTTGIAVRWGDDPYLIDVPLQNVAIFTTFPATVPIDKNYGKIYYRTYCTSTLGTLSKSDIQIF